MSRTVAYDTEQGTFQAPGCSLERTVHIAWLHLTILETSPLRAGKGMSVLRQAARHSRCLQEPVLARVAALAQSQLPCSAASAVQHRPFTCSSSCQAPVHIEDEPYCRQRQLLVLGNRVPVLAPDAWVAPNAVVVGDVDLFDKVCAYFPCKKLYARIFLGSHSNSCIVDAFTE